MINLKACATIGIFASVAASSVPPGQVAPIASAAASQDETIYRPECPPDETSSGRLACRIADAGRG
jgi:hypothetical protein